MADPNVVSLQNAINRFATVALGGQPIGVDGQIGTKTAAATVKALGWIANNVNGAQATAAELITRLVLDSGAYNLAQVQQSASGLATYLNQNANATGLPVAPRPMVAGGAAGNGYSQTTTAPALNPATTGGGSAMAANIGEMWRKLPTWGKVLGGALAGLGLIAGISAVRKPKAQ